MVAADAKQHLVHSHAHEEDIPGTVNLNAQEGDDTGYGQALFPVPAEDPNDPLQWTHFKKTMILIICSAYSFIANAALLGPSPYINVWAEDFDISPDAASQLISYPNLAFGFGSLIFVPCYLKFGRRPVMLVSLIIFCAAEIGASQATTYGGLLAARVVAGFGSCVCEALPVQLVNDIFFLHERGERIGYYTACLALGTIGALPAGYILNGGYGWRLYFYVIFAFGVALLILAFFFVEETSYDRDAAMALAAASTPSSEGNEKASDGEGGRVLEPATSTTSAALRRKSFLATLSPRGRYDPEVPFFTMMARSFTYFLVPQVLWVVASFGINIGLAGLGFSYTFPILITAPPYNWSVLNSGLFSVAAIVGYFLAIPLTSSSDRLAAYLTKRNGNIREAEMRLGVMLPAMIIGPIGTALYGITAQFDLHWVLFFVGGGLSFWGSYFYYTFTLAYAVDSYNSNTSEMLIAMNIGKQAVSFGFGLKVLSWVTETGYAPIISGVFAGVLLINNLALIVFMVWGKRIRRFMAGTWLARLHKSSIREVVTH